MKNVNKKILALAIVATMVFSSLTTFTLSTSANETNQIAYAGTLAGGDLGTATGIIFGGASLVWGAIAFVPGLNVIAGTVALTYGA